MRRGLRARRGGRAGAGNRFPPDGLGLWAPALIVWTVQLCDVVERFTPLPALGTLTLLSAVALLVGGRRLPGSRWCAVSATMRGHWEGRGPTRGAREEPAILLPALAALALLLGFVLTWVFRSWSWDGVWYHLPIVRLALQRHSPRWVSSHIHYAGSKFSGAFHLVL